MYLNWRCVEEEYRPEWIKSGTTKRQRRAKSRKKAQSWAKRHLWGSNLPFLILEGVAMVPKRNEVRKGWEQWQRWCDLQRSHNTLNQVASLIALWVEELDFYTDMSIQVEEIEKDQKWTLFKVASNIFLFFSFQETKFQ